MHLARPLALGDLLTQIRQPDVRAVPLDQGLLAILPSAPAFLASEADQFARMFMQGERAVHARAKLFYNARRMIQENTGQYGVGL